MNEQLTAKSLRSRTRTALVIAVWGAIAVVASITDAPGAVGGLIAMLFALLGPGVAFVFALDKPLSLALWISVLVGVGLATCVVIGQALIILGVYSPTAVISIELALVLTVLVTTVRPKQRTRGVAS